NWTETIYLSVSSSRRPKTQCEQHRDSLQRGSDGLTLVGAFVPECDEQGQYRPQQCHGSTGHCWCVDSRGQERQGTRTPPGSPQFNCDAPGKYIYSMEFKFRDHKKVLRR
uniref:Thyroglobulin type-1 domain-containing protein n=1 Tax=Astyanax mexicanus TaxID=7994 RepID=A0A3B1J1G6_ASTMX